MALLLLLLAASGCGGGPEVRDTQTPAAVAVSSPRPTASAAQAAAGRFLRFARGDGPGRAVPWGHRVRYAVQGQVVAVLGARSASTRASWQACPEDPAGLDGRACPLSVLRSIAGRDDDASPVVVETRSPGAVLGCDRYREPRVAPGSGLVWLRPSPDRRDCFTDMAVALTVSAGGRITAVDLALSGP